MDYEQLLALFENMGFNPGILGFPVVLGIFSFVCMCIIMHKCGRTGWCLIIPIYNIYVCFKVWWKTKKFGKFFLWIIVMILASVGLGIVTANGETGLIPEPAATIILVVCLIAEIISMIIVVVMSIKLNCGHLAKAFGKDSGFAVGLFFLPVIFQAIIALDKDIKYVGPQP